MRIKSVEHKFSDQNTVLLLIQEVYKFIYDKYEYEYESVDDETFTRFILDSIYLKDISSDTILHKVIGCITSLQLYDELYCRASKYFSAEDFLDYARQIVIESGVNPHLIPKYFYYDSSKSDDEEYDEAIFEQRWDDANHHFFLSCLNRFPSQVFDYFWNKPDILMSFNLKVANKLKNFKVEDHSVLERNGQVKRLYLPKWLKDIINYRENGLCYYCQCPLTQTFQANQDTHLDHLVPIACGGSNDPTNFVLSCPKCNHSKGVEILSVHPTYYWPNTKDYFS